MIKWCCNYNYQKVLFIIIVIIHRLNASFYVSIMIDIRQCFSHLKYDAYYYVHRVLCIQKSYFLKLSQDGEQRISPTNFPCPVQINFPTEINYVIKVFVCCFPCIYNDIMRKKNPGGCATRLPSRRAEQTAPIASRSRPRSARPVAPPIKKVGYGPDGGHLKNCHHLWLNVQEL